MKLAALLITLVFSCAQATAGDERMRLVEPRETELTLLKLVREIDLSASYSGRIWITGTFVGRWPLGATDLREKEPEYLLVPDRKSIEKLPYFVLKEPPYFNRYKVRAISVVNGKQALHRAVSEADARRLLERRVNHVRSSGSFLIEEYVVGVECDAPWARAVLVRSELPEQLAFAHRAVPEGC
jgi:hypothetical protein